MCCLTRRTEQTVMQHLCKPLQAENCLKVQEPATFQKSARGQTLAAVSFHLLALTVLLGSKVKLSSE